MNRIDKRVWINILVLLLFMVLTFFVGIHHEPWADEAQAWLIARDAGIFEIFSNISRYEGHPALWYCILKVFNLIHFPYKYFFLIPWICGSIGVYLILFKSKLPDFIKYVFPFTFYPFYQYSVIARNYSLIFPMLAGIALFYPKRLEHPYIYAILLILTANVSAYGFVIAFSLMCFFTYDIISKYRTGKKLLPAIFALGFCILTVAYMPKPDDCIALIDINLSRFNIAKILYITTRGYFNTAPRSIILTLQILVTVGLYVSAAYAFCKNKAQLLFFIGINFPLAVFLTILYCHYWHSGYLICTLIFTCWSLAEENKLSKVSFKQNCIFYLILGIIFSVQIMWSANCFIFDIKNSYSGSKAIAQYIKSKKLDNQQITGIGFHVVGVQPYFDKNIFSNLEHSYWVWDKKSNDDYYKKSLNLAPIVVVAASSISDNQESLEIIRKNYRKIYQADGQLYAKGERKEYTTFIIYEKINKE